MDEANAHCGVNDARCDEFVDGDSNERRPDRFWSGRRQISHGLIFHVQRGTATSIVEKVTKREARKDLRRF